MKDKGPLLSQNEPKMTVSKMDFWALWEVFEIISKYEALFVFGMVEVGM